MDNPYPGTEAHSPKPRETYSGGPLPLGLRFEPADAPADPAALAAAREAALRTMWDAGDGLAVLEHPWRGLPFQPSDLQTLHVRDTWSIVIPVRGAHEALGDCLDALHHSIEHRLNRAQVVLVAHRDEIDDVRQIAMSRGLGNATLVATDTPLGFPAASNTGASHAYGDRFLFLNSDACVPRRWREYFDIALDYYAAAGPSGTNVSGFQSVQLEEVQDYEAVGPSRPAFRKPPIPRLVGFCLAVHAEVFHNLGGWNEEYGVGNFDDDDLSLRLALAHGRRGLVWVPNVYVRHIGGASFRELPAATVVYERLLAENSRKFAARWGWCHDQVVTWWRSL